MRDDHGVSRAGETCPRPSDPRRSPGPGSGCAWSRPSSRAWRRRLRGSASALPPEGATAAGLAQHLALLDLVGSGRRVARGFLLVLLHAGKAELGHQRGPPAFLPLPIERLIRRRPRSCLLRTLEHPIIRARLARISSARLSVRRSSSASNSRILADSDLEIPGLVTGWLPSATRDCGSSGRR